MQNCYSGQNDRKFPMKQTRLRKNCASRIEKSQAYRMFKAGDSS